MFIFLLWVFFFLRVPGGAIFLLRVHGAFFLLRVFFAVGAPGGRQRVSE